MFFNKDKSPSVRFFGGGGAPSMPSSPEKPIKQEETRRIDRSAEDARGQEQRRIPPGRKATMYSGVEKKLKERLGK